MAKLKEVRALKASGVEPLAPTLIKRILHNLVLKAEDRRWASEIGRLSMLGRAHRPADLGRLSCRGDLRPLRVAARAPAQRRIAVVRDRARPWTFNGHDHSQDAAIEADFTGLLRAHAPQPALTRLNGRTGVIVP
jgi:hypothetical protein